MVRPSLQYLEDQILLDEGHLPSPRKILNGMRIPENRSTVENLSLVTNLPLTVDSVKSNAFCFRSKLFCVALGRQQENIREKGVPPEGVRSMGGEDMILPDRVELERKCLDAKRNNADSCWQPREKKWQNLVVVGFSLFV